MRDIATLKERVDYAEQHLKATETARNRESEALMDTWRKVRERFIHQEGEIARYRAEVETLTESNESLSRMVDDLIATIDGNIERGRDETVPKIATLAGDLLASEPTADDLSQFAENVPKEPAVDPLPDVAPDPGPEVDPARSRDEIGLDRTEPDQAPLDTLSSDVGEDEIDGANRDVAQESLSPGIRNLIQRVESSVGEPDRLSVGSDDDVDGEDGVDEDLARELQEIEMLRSELSGLRDRISAGDG